MPASFSERNLGDEYDGSKVHPKVGKGRLNLLNPMSLLARRRSAQTVTQKHEELPMSISTLPVPAMPEDYDPRIRGKIVHDFSAPRTRRQHSGESASSAMNTGRSSSTQQYRTDSRRPDSSIHPNVHDGHKHTKSPEKAPLFKEHFNDDRPVLQPESKGYLHSFATASSIPHPEHEPPQIPAFARGLPARLPDTEERSRTPLQSLPETHTSPPSRSLRVSPPPAVESTISPPRSVRAPSTEATATAPVAASALPRHMTSNASRFSFDLSGVGSSAQEKLLEEKHKQKQAARKSIFRDVDDDASELDDYANYGFEDDDGLEERIPGINVDLEDDDELEERIPGINADPEDEPEDDLKEDAPPVSAGLQHFHFTPSIPSTMMSPATAESEQTSFPTPRDDQGQPIGFAFSKESPSLKHQSLQLYQLGQTPGTLDLMHGLGISSVPNTLQDEKTTNVDVPAPAFDEEDLYFDDGDIQLEVGDTELADFDESIFDDENGALHDIPAQNARNLEAARALSGQETGTVQGRYSGAAFAQEAETDAEKASDYPTVDEAITSETAPNKKSMQENELKGLTEGNMAAFQQALISAAAAQDAEAKARYERSPSASQESEDLVSPSQPRHSRPGLVPDSSHLSQEVDHLSNPDLPNDFSFDDDDNMDDVMIAAANAEALENDEEGFYGQEFGFYARAHGKNSAEMTNGGYFIPRGMEGINRSHSGKANFQEPSLTPITERSEWSTRNSMASIHAFGIPQSVNSLPSPAIADLIGQGAFEDDMTLGALMKLRRGAWGGSETSLHSSAGSQTSNSPHPLTSPRDHTNMPSSPDAPAQMSGSTYSVSGSVGIPESEEEDEDELASPTVTQNTPRKSQHTPTISPFTQMAIPSFSPKPERQRAHSRNSSGAESVSYVKDPEAPGRYIIERKRTLDSGEIELIGREVLVGNI